MRSRERALVVAIVIGLAGFLPASSAHAQATFLTLGQGFYNPGDCPVPPATITTYRAGFETDVIGVSATYNNEDYPWPPDDEGLSSARQEVSVDHGDALQIAVELFPIGLFGDRAARLGSWVRPFLGLGLHRSGDGEAAEPDSNQPLETLAILGSTDVLLTYGVKLTVPASGRLGVRLELRGNSVFAGDFTRESTSGARTQVPGTTLTWGEYSVGFTFRVR